MMDVAPTPTLLLVGGDHPYTAALRLALTAGSPVRLVGEVPPGEEGVAHAACLRPDALLLAVNLPGQRLAPLAPLVRELRVASLGSKMLVSAARVALDAVVVRAPFALSAARPHVGRYAVILHTSRCHHARC